MFRLPLSVDFRQAERNMRQATGCLSDVRELLCVSRCLAQSSRRPMVRNVPTHRFRICAMRVGISDMRLVFLRPFGIIYVLLGTWRILLVGR